MPTSLDMLFRMTPEILLIVGAVWIIVGNAFAPQRAGWWVMALATVAMAGWALAQQGMPVVPAPSTGGESVHVGSADADSVVVAGLAIHDELAQAIRWFAIVLAFLLVVMASRAGAESLFGEQLGSILLILAGIMIAASATNLVLLFLGLELVSIPTYILLFLGRANRQSLEATAKYFLLSILASAVMLYGFSFLYGSTGSMDLSRISANVREPASPLGAGGIWTMGMVLVLLGLSFKLGSFPAHFYAPDVYEGTTSVNAALLAVAPKVAGIVALVRLFLMNSMEVHPFLWHMFLLLALATMTIGNVCALWQNNIRRLLAYSSIAHAGYMLIGLAVALAMWKTSTGLQGASATLFYLVVYAIAVLGTFAGLAYLASARDEIQDVEQLAGMGRSYPVVAGALGLLMFSLSGIPPLAGFWGKLGLFASAVEAAGVSAAGVRSPWFLVLVVGGALNAAIAAAYYLRIVRTLFFRSGTQQLAPEGGSGARNVAVFAALLTLAVGILPGPLLVATRNATCGLNRDRAPLMVTAAPVSSGHQDSIVTRP